MHYVIGDVHGCFDEMMSLLEKIESMDSDAKIFFVGDFIDRGPQVDKVLEWCLANITADGKYRSVCGNHEELALEWYAEWLQWWTRFGMHKNMGRFMPESEYDFSRWMDAMDKLTPEKMKPYIDFFRSLPLNIELEIKTVSGKKQKYRIAHAFHDFFLEEDDEAQDNINLWERNYKGNEVSDDIIVHGHTPTITMEYTAQIHDYSHPGMICYRKNDINVDGGCVFTDGYIIYPAYLCAIRLEDLEEIYSCSLEEQFAKKIDDKAQLEKYICNYKNRYFSENSKYREELLKQIM